ncbi:ATP-binding protein [Vibrio spartinae]|uniref:histidine kinase n=1 Tax=Vibrio spartinae TaxID=1918945 RepID=A0A1N6M8V2_9VIBR|nr:ATP-binding protein [Vibrio spartinae]SIO95787.1 Signal transduction histidine-protein kinase BaeS [Vibrio spartinae]
MKLAGLSRQIALSMMKIAMGSALLVIFGSFVFYYLWEKYWPNDIPSESDITPSFPEWIWILCTFAFVIWFAVHVAIKLSRRILEPLNSVAEGIRTIAKGDLDVRVSVGDRSLGEASLLAEDFNLLAEKLQQMSEAQNFWNAAIAHELRTPVTILRGRLQGLAEGIFIPDKAQFLKLLAQVEGLSHLIEDLRVVSLMNSGELNINIEAVDLSAEIKSVADLAENMLQSAGQSVRLDLHTQSVLCDSMRIRQALLAILDNASKYAVPGTVTIRSKEQDGVNFLSVADEGPGIAAELLPNVFTAFHRAKDASQRGSGLGLAVVAAIAQAHQGEVTCFLNEAGGTTIELCWPSSISAASNDEFHQ